MIIIGTIPITSQELLLEMRQKLGELLDELNFSDVEKTRAVTGASDLCRSILKTAPELFLTIGIDTIEGKNQLALSFATDTKGLQVDTSSFKDIFDGITEVKETQIGGKALSAYMSLKDPTFEPQPDFIIRSKNLLERKSQEELTKAIETEKLTAIGMFAAGVVHELNNPMMGILSFIQYCLKHIEKDHKIAPILQDTETEVTRCIHTMQNMLSFARVKESGSEPITQEICSQLIDKILQLLNYRLEKEHIEVIREYQDEDHPVKMHVSLIQHVFLNIIVNAINAMDEMETKKLTICVKPFENGVLTSVTDTGCGIPLENYHKIYEPFFTTSTGDKGTGLGLPISKRMVEEHSGQLSFQSEVGLGTTFNILLPKEAIYEENTSN